MAEYTFRSSGSGGTHRWARHAVLVTPLALVNGAAVYGQVQWAMSNLTDDSIPFAILFALTVESIAVYLAYEAHTALLAGDASLRLRTASYLAAGTVGALNYSHFANPDWTPTASALVFGALSSISPWLWSIRSRSLRRDHLRGAGLIDPRSAHFAAAKWINFPIRTVRAYRWSVDHGVQEERTSWESSRTAHRPGKVAERGRRHIAAGHTPTADQANPRTTQQRRSSPAVSHIGDDLRVRVRDATAAGERVTGATVAEWLGVSARTGRRRLASLSNGDSSLTEVDE